MKKIIALVLILVVSTVLIQTKDHEPVFVAVIESETNPNWNYIKRRLFDNNIVTNDKSLFRGKSQKPFKFEGPILIDISGATKQDSAAIKETIAKIKAILPHKTIDYFSNYTGLSLDSITINNDALNALGKFDEGRSIRNKIYNGRSLRELLNESTIRMNFGSGINFKENFQFNQVPLSDGDFVIRAKSFLDVSNYYRSVYSDHINNILFKFPDTLSYKNRKQYVEYEFLKALCKTSTNIKGHFNSTRNVTPVGVFEWSNHVRGDFCKLNEKDTFLIQKLYSDDFLDQFKMYLYEYYPWQYAFSFLNKELAVIKTYLLLIVIAIIVLIISMSLFHKKKFKYSFFNYFFPILIIFSYLINLSFIHQYILEFGSVALKRDTIAPMLFWVVVVSLISTLFLWGIEKIVIKKQFYFTFQLILKVIFTTIAFMFPFIISVLFPFYYNGEYIEISDFIRISVPIFVLLFLALGRGFVLYLNHYSDNLLKEKDVELSKLKQVNAEAEVRLLQSQINPHFLYNALNSIASLALVDGEKTQKMSYSLSNLFKYSINRKGKKMSTIGDEIKMVQNYLDIEKIRFGDRLQFTIEVDPELEKVEIPLFIIQPLVENAIKHGVSKIEGNGKIALKIKKREKEILISIKDNGPHFSEGLVNGHGLQTVYDLLYLSYGEKASLNWQNAPEKKITILILKE